MKNQVKKENNIYKAGVSDNESVWQFGYKNGAKGNFYKQYLDEFKGKLGRGGYLKDRTMGTHLEYFIQEISNVEGDKVIKTNGLFTNFYFYEGSFIKENGTYTGAFLEDEKLGIGDGLDIHIKLITPKGFFSKVKHNRLKNKLNKILRRK